MSRCLVTGHKGYIGSKLFNALKQSGHEVIGIDLKDGHDINKDLFHGENKNSFHPLYYNFKPEYIFHLACIPRVGYSIENPVETTKNNILATTNVLNFAKAVKAKRVIFSSSSSVIGDGDGAISPYALQKKYSEMECKLYSKIYGVDTVSLRYFNVYSEDQTSDGSYATAIANWMWYIRLNKSPFINGDGSLRRDMVHVDDVVSANIFIMNHQNLLHGEIFDVGTGDNISIKEIAEIVNFWMPEVKFDFRPPRVGDVLLTKANIQPLKKIGWEAKIKIQDGINLCFKNLKQQKMGLGRSKMRNSTPMST
jgi:UDP-glucose 4-epimerase